MKRIFFLAAFLTVCNSVWAFAPCNNKVPKEISFEPALDVCDGAAAIVLGGKYKDSFSAVVRDCKNNDRDPCHKDEDTCPTNFSSPYKAQKKFYALATYGASNKTKPVVIHCLKEPGDSQVFTLVRRMTIKLKNPASEKDILRLCLKSRTKALNPITIKSTKTIKFDPTSGATPICRTQQYLDCDYSYAAICNPS